MRSNSRAAEVAGLAAEQNGLVTSRQAHTLVGATAHQLKRMADSGQLERLHHGIYRVARFPYDEHQPQRVAWLALDPGVPVWERLDQDVPGGVLSHATAARMHDLGDLDADIIELTAPRRIRLSIPDVVVHRGDLTRDDWEIVDDLPVTTVARTIGDLAAATVDAGHLATVVRDAVAGDRLSVDYVAEVLAPHAFRYGHRLFDGAGFRDALIDAAGVSDNAVALARIASQSQLALQRKELIRQLLGAIEGAATDTELRGRLSELADRGALQLSERQPQRSSSGAAGPAGSGRQRALIEAFAADIEARAHLERFGDQLAEIAAAAERLDPERRNPRITEAAARAAEHVKQERQ